MKKINPLRTAILFSLFISNTAFAWDHSIELGYGQSHDPNNTRYTNSGVMLSGDLLPIHRTQSTFWSMTGSLNRWNSSAPNNRNLTAAALSLALRWYTPKLGSTNPYALGSVGPAYMTTKKFGTNTQAYHWAFQTNLGLGTEIKQFDMNLRLAHYSNASTGKPNEGFNILYLASFGYLM